MCRAVRIVRIGEMDSLRASKYFFVLSETLERFLKDTSLSPEELINVHIGRRTLLPTEHENKLVEYCITTDQRYYGLRRQDIKRVAFHLAIRNGSKHPFNREKSAVGKKWLRFFLKGHTVLSVRTEGISEARVESFTSEKVARFFFDVCESELGKVNHPGHRMFNDDETRNKRLQHKHSKFVSMRGKKEIVSNIDRKGKSNHCCNLYEYLWKIRSTISLVSEKKYEIGEN